MSPSSMLIKMLLLTRLISPPFSFALIPTQLGNSRSFCTKLSAESKSLTAADILAKARKASGVPDEEPAPKIFEDNMLEDMREMLLSLEKRVKDGPGSISAPEAEEFQVMANRVLVEMKEKEAQRISGVSSGTTLQGASPTAPETTSVASPPTPTSPIVDAPTTDEEGPAYDGEGGMGLARGTANTYVIPGMDEMSPEEYQKALQESISNRQKNRKSSGKYGNRATWDYLNNLTGESGVLKADPSDD